MKNKNLITSIRFEAVTFSYENEENILEAVDFDFPLNTTVTVDASSGAGRHILLQILAGLTQPTHGRYLVNDSNVTDMSFEEFLPIRQKIGYSFDMGGLIHNKSLIENCVLPLTYHNILTAKQAHDKVHSLFEKFKIAKQASKKPSEIMGSMRKLVNLLRAVITDPELLILDDPTVGLNQETSLMFFDYLSELRQNENLKHVFMSSFDEKFLGLFEHQEILIDNGLIHFNVDQSSRKSANL